MKKTLSVVTAISLFATFPFTVMADEVPAASEYDLVEYDYVNKTERIISADEIFDYSATTTTTDELDSIASYVAEMEQTVSRVLSLIHPVLTIRLRLSMQMVILSQSIRVLCMS